MGTWQTITLLLRNSFFFDEDEVDEMINESDLPDVFTLVQAGITAGVLNRSPTELDLSEADAV